MWSSVSRVSRLLRARSSSAIPLCSSNNNLPSLSSVKNLCPGSLSNLSTLCSISRPLSLSVPRTFCSSSPPSFDFLCHETLESLCERFEELVENDPRMEEADVNLSSGVLNVLLPEVGTFVINKQTPNRQIWLSSPISGPYRFDLDPSGASWVYKHSGESLHSLLDREIGQTVFQMPKDQSGFEDCFMGANNPPGQWLEKEVNNLGSKRSDVNTIWKVLKNKMQHGKKCGDT